MIEINLNDLWKGEKVIHVKATPKMKAHTRKIKTAAEADVEMEKRFAVLRNYKEAAARTNEWLDRHPERNRDAGMVENFTVDDYDVINEVLRSDTPEEQIDDMINDQINSISKFLRDAPKFNGTVYRGMGFDPKISEQKDIYDKFISDVKNNNVVTLPAFTSTTCDKTIATQFTGEGVPKYSARIILEIKSKSGVALNGVAAFPKELEVLFDKASEFKIINVEEIDGVNHIHLEEI